MITFDPEGLKARLTELEEAMGAPGFWDDQRGAARISSEHARLTRRLERYDQLSREAEDLGELVTLVSDDGELDEVEQNAVALRGQLDRLQEDSLFSGDYDAGSAVVSIHAGTGGPTRRTGPRSCSACTSAGRPIAGSRPSSSRSPPARRRA